MRSFRTITTGMLLVSAAAILTGAAPRAFAQQPCDSSPGACFVPLLGQVAAYFGADGTTGWSVYWMLEGNQDFLQFRPNGEVLLHIIDQQATLIAVSDSEPDPLFGTGQVTINGVFNPVDGGFRCPTTAIIEGTVGGRWLEGVVQILPAKTGSYEGQGDWETWETPGCYVHKLDLQVGP